MGIAAPVPDPGPAPTAIAADDARRLAPVLAALGVSLLAHVAIVIGGALLRAEPAPHPAEQPLAVEILTPAEFAAMTAPPAPETGPPPAAEAPPPSPDDGMVRPPMMLSAANLADPRSAEARRILRTLDDTDRMIQLCGIEAMEQVHAWREALHPDRVVAYASAEVAVSRDGITADGAAFRSGHAWYALRFDCHLAPDHETVTAFAFRVGKTIPPTQWEAQNLPTDFDGAPD
jgi:hypothetical protein